MPPAATGMTAVPGMMFTLSRDAPNLSEAQSYLAVLLLGTKGASPSKEEFAMSFLISRIRLPDQDQTLAEQ